MTRDQTRTDSGVSGTGSVTSGEFGADRSYDRAYDPETGTYTANRTTTTNSGKTVSSSATVVCDGNGNCSRDAGYTGPQGGEGGTASTVSRSADGTITGQSATTRPDGSVVTRDRQSTGEAGNRSGSVVINTPEGESQRVFDRAYTEGEGFGRSSQTTGPDGRTTSVEAGASCADGNCERGRVRTGPNGETREVTNSVTHAAPGDRTGQRSVTGRNGETRTSERWVRVDRERDRNP
jgi:hypothetical protein